MITGRYTKDYRLSDRLDQKGRVRTSAEYIGEHYRLGDFGAAARLARLLTVLCAVGWLCFVTSLVPQSHAAHLIYVILPHAFTAIPLYTVSAGVVTVLHKGSSELIHSEADKLTGRFRGASFVGMLMTALILAAFIVTYFVDGVDFVKGDIVFLICEAVMCSAFVTAYANRSKFDTKKVSR